VQQIHQIVRTVAAGAGRHPSGSVTRGMMRTKARLLHPSDTLSLRHAHHFPRMLAPADSATPPGIHGGTTGAHTGRADSISIVGKLGGEAPDWSAAPCMGSRHAKAARRQSTAPGAGEVVRIRCVVAGSLWRRTPSR
jgi:hypothetical protein